MVIYTPVVGYTGGEDGDYQDLDISLSEHNCPISFDVSDIEDVPILRVASQGNGYQRGGGNWGVWTGRVWGEAEREAGTETEEAGEDSKEYNHND